MVIVQLIDGDIAAEAGQCALEVDGVNGGPAFFPPRPRPNSDGGPRNKNAVVARQVPTGHAIGHVVLNHQSHGRLLYPVGVLALERGEVGLIGREGVTTGQTAMCGEQICRSIGRPPRETPRP